MPVFSTVNRILLVKMSSLKDRVTLKEAETEFSALMTKLDPADYNSFLNFVKKNWILPDLARGLNTIGEVPSTIT